MKLRLLLFGHHRLHSEIELESWCASSTVRMISDQSLKILVDFEKLYVETAGFGRS